MAVEQSDIRQVGLVGRLVNRLADSFDATMFFMFAPKGIEVHSWEEVGTFMSARPLRGKIRFKTLDLREIEEPARLVVDIQDVPPPY